MTHVNSAAAPAQPPSLATAFGQLARARAREFWLRTGIWGWCTVSLGWLLPLGPWSATRLPLSAALIVGCGLAVCGAVLAVLHRMASSTDDIRAALGAVRRLREPVTTINAGHVS